MNMNQMMMQPNLSGMFGGDGNMIQNQMMNQMAGLNLAQQPQDPNS